MMSKKIIPDHNAFEQPDWLDGMTDSNPHIRSQSFEGFMNAWQKPIYFYMRRLLMNHQDADDASQEVIIQVFKSIDSFQKKSTFSTWLITIAYRKAMDAMRKRKTHAWTSLDATNQAALSHLNEDALFDADEAERRLHSAIANLPPRQRQVFILRYFDELSFREIAAISGKTEGALKASFHHAVKKVRATVVLPR
mgnify:CR=1 FL=1|tara:strand:- start:2210 stop:2794 length:585 start_codon:yes stop_codon:yes gene_type:complete